MVTALLNRYYGDANVTRSVLTLIGDDGNALFECEAREMRYEDYANEEKQVGCSYFCLPRGKFPCKPSSAPNNPICLRVQGVKGHRGTRLYFDEARDIRPNAVLLGYGNKAQQKSCRQLVRIAEARERFLEVMYRHITEEFVLVVENEELRLPNMDASK